MQQEAELLFEIDDDARWMGELTLLVFSWMAVVSAFWYFRVDFSAFVVGLQEMSRPKAVLGMLVAVMVIFSAGLFIKVLSYRAGKDRKMLFYADRIVSSVDNKSFHIAEIDEGFFLSMLLTGEYSKLQKRTERYRKYVMAVLFPLLLPIAIAGKLASLSACAAYLLKYRHPVPVKAMLFPYLALVNRKNERVVLVVSGPNREKVLDYLRHCLYIDPASLPKHFAVLPGKSSNLEPQISARSITMTARNLDAWEWYRGGGLKVTADINERRKRFDEQESADLF